MGYETPDVGVADCTDNPGLPKSSKFCLEGRPYTKLPGLDSAMTTGDMRGKIDVRSFPICPAVIVLHVFMKIMKILVFFSHIHACSIRSA
jgi:hypothetical protein